MAEGKMGFVNAWGRPQQNPAWWGGSKWAGEGLGMVTSEQSGGVTFPRSHPGHSRAVLGIRPPQLLEIPGWQGHSSPRALCEQPGALGSLRWGLDGGGDMVQKGKSHGNQAELSPWGEAELFHHPPVDLCPKLSS